MRKVIALIICAALMILPAGCGGGEGPTTAATAAATQQPTTLGPKVRLKIAYSAQYNGTGLMDAINTGISDLNAQSGGLMSVALSDNGGGADDAAMFESAMSGDLSVYIGDAEDMSQKIPELDVCKIPMMFSDADTCSKALSGSFIGLMQPYFNNAGLELIGAYCPAMRNLTSDKAVTSAADIKSLKVRTEENDDYSSLFWKTAGCFPSGLGWGNVYIALKQKMFDAQESADNDINNYKLYEVQGYLIKTNHTPKVSIIVMNKSQYDALSEDEIKWLGGFISEVGQKAREAQAAKDSQLEDIFKQNGMQVSDAPGDMIAALKSSVQPVIDLLKTKIDPALVDNYIAACKQN